MNKKIFLFFLIFLAVFAIPSFANTYTVTNCADSGAGSFRQAILNSNSNAGIDAIEFNIPSTEPYTSAGGYTTEAGVSWWRIIPTTIANSGANVLPAILDAGTYINGSTQRTNQGDINPSGPEIEIDGTVGTRENGIYILRNNCTVEGLTINRFATAGIIIYGVDSCEVRGCYVGTDPTGTMARSNNNAGISVRGKYNIIGGRNAGEGNLISGNNNIGLAIVTTGADSNEVYGNYIGVDRLGTAALANGYGIYISSGAQFNVIGGLLAGQRNIISGNTVDGIDVLTNSNTILGNYIGTDVNGTASLGNGTNAVAFGGFDNYANFNTVGPNNIMANSQRGVYMYQGKFNKITQNSIFSNSSSAIHLENIYDANSSEASPVISTASYQLPDGPLTVSGTAPASSSVEVFKSENVPLASGGGGKTYFGVTAAGADTTWSFSYATTESTGSVCATATDPFNNTSAFSLNVAITTLPASTTTTTTTTSSTTTSTGSSTTTTASTTTSSTAPSTTTTTTLPATTTTTTSTTTTTVPGDISNVLVTPTDGTNRINLSYTLSSDQPRVIIQILDSSGNVAVRKTITSGAGTQVGINTIQLISQGLPKGAYRYQIIAPNLPPREGNFLLGAGK